MNKYYLIILHTAYFYTDSVNILQINIYFND